MKIRYLGILMIVFLAAFSLPSTVVLTFGAEPEALTFEGRIMDLDSKKNVIIVNEKRFMWNKDSLFCDEKGNIVKGNQFKVEQLKMNALVHIEAAKTTGKRQFVILKLSLPQK